MEQETLDIIRRLENRVSELEKQNNKSVFENLVKHNTPMRICAPLAPLAGGKVALLIGSGLFGVYYGSGVPTVSASKGSLYLRSDGSSTSTRAYINTDGGTTWTAITTAA